MTNVSAHTTPRVHLKATLEGLRPSATLAINEKMAQLAAQGHRIFAMGFGQSPFPVPDRVVEALKANAFRREYQPVQGLPELRHAIAAYHRQVHQLRATASDILIGPGTKELMFLLQLAYDGELLLPSPSWVTYEPQAVILGRRVRWLPTSKDNGWRLTASTLDDACRSEAPRPRLLILNYPNNPTGLTYRAAELEGLAKVAQEHQLLVLSDELYGDLDHSAIHRSIATWYPEGTVVTNGLSKWCGAGGWRLGSFCFPPSLRWLLDSMIAIASETFSGVSAPIQYAAVAAFQRDREIERYLFQSRRILRALGRIVAARLQACGVGVTPPEGGFYVFPDFTGHQDMLHGRGIVTSAQLCQRLLEETGVAMLPGADFGRPASELTCRIAYVNFNGGECLAAAEAVADPDELTDGFFDAHCPDVLEAIDRVGRWLAC